MEELFMSCVTCGVLVISEVQQTNILGREIWGSPSLLRFLSIKLWWWDGALAESVTVHKTRGDLDVCFWQVAELSGSSTWKMMPMTGHNLISIVVLYYIKDINLSDFLCWYDPLTPKMGLKTVTNDNFLANDSWMDDVWLRWPPDLPSWWPPAPAEPPRSLAATLGSQPLGDTLLWHTNLSHQLTGQSWSHTVRATGRTSSTPSWCTLLEALGSFENIGSSRHQLFVWKMGEKM